MDRLGIYERQDDLCPFVLLDGHQSHFDKIFLQYINDPVHKWVVAIGVPHGTHIWQVGDPSEQNGSFKMSFKKCLDRFLEWKCQLNLPLAFCCTDIIPLVLCSYILKVLPE